MSMINLFKKEGFYFDKLPETTDFTVTENGIAFNKSSIKGIAEAQRLGGLTKKGLEDWINGPFKKRPERFTLEFFGVSKEQQIKFNDHGRERFEAPTMFGIRNGGNPVFFSGPYGEASDYLRYFIEDFEMGQQRIDDGVQATLSIEDIDHLFDLKFIDEKGELCLLTNEVVLNNMSFGRFLIRLQTKFSIPRVFPFYRNTPTRSGTLHPYVAYQGRVCFGDDEISSMSLLDKIHTTLLVLNNYREDSSPIEPIKRWL